jgi:cytochrome c oxidase assembly factor CtaG
LFWLQVVDSPPVRARLDHGLRAVYLTGALLVSWVLAIVLGLATHPLYGAYPSLTDQQLAAGIMWVPGSIPFCVALFVAAYRWLDPAAGTRRRRMPLDLRPKET